VRGVLPAAEVTAVPCSCERGSLALEPIEHNPSLELRRRVLTGLDVAGAPAAAAAALVAPRPTRAPPHTRVELLHLPMRPALVSASFASLTAAGYLPVGVRPHRRRTSEIVLQRVAAAHAREAIGSMVLAGAHLRRLADGWLEACARTS
jgi:hypothetical protein